MKISCAFESLSQAWSGEIEELGQRGLRTLTRDQLQRAPGWGHKLWFSRVRFDAVAATATVVFFAHILTAANSHGDIGEGQLLFRSVGRQCQNPNRFGHLLPVDRRGTC